MHKLPVISPPFPQRVSCVPLVVFRGHQVTRVHTNPQVFTPQESCPPHTEWNTKALIQHRCRGAQLLRAPARPPAPGRPQCRCRCPDLTHHTGPHNITAWGNMATGMFSVIVPFLTSTFTSCWECFHLRQWQTGRPQKSPVAVSALTFPREDKNSLTGYSSMLPPPTPLKSGRLPWITPSNYLICQNRLFSLCPSIWWKDLTTAKQKIK